MTGNNTPSVTDYDGYIGADHSDHDSIVRAQVLSAELAMGANVALVTGNPILAGTAIETAIHEASVAASEANLSLVRASREKSL